MVSPLTIKVLLVEVYVAPFKTIVASSPSTRIAFSPFTPSLGGGVAREPSKDFAAFVIQFVTESAV